jgi:hypothetical protein
MTNGKAIIVPPGSITTARFVTSHHRRIQFCWNGVTGTCMRSAYVIDVNANLSRKFMRSLALNANFSEDRPAKPFWRQALLSWGRLGLQCDFGSGQVLLCR